MHTIVPELLKSHFQSNIKIMDNCFDKPPAISKEVQEQQKMNKQPIRYSQKPRAQIKQMQKKYKQQRQKAHMPERPIIMNDLQEKVMKQSSLKEIKNANQNSLQAVREQSVQPQWDNNETIAQNPPSAKQMVEKQNVKKYSNVEVQPSAVSSKPSNTKSRSYYRRRKESSSSQSVSYGASYLNPMSAYNYSNPINMISHHHHSGFDNCQNSLGGFGAFDW